MDKLYNQNLITLNEMLRHKTTQEKAFQFFDSLDTADLNFMKGKWKGDEIITDHPMEGILKATKWYGKIFKNKDEVHPLLFEKKNGQLYFGNPGRIIIGKSFHKIPRKFLKVVFPLLYPFVKTKSSKARLRLIEYRGKVSSCMVYDQLPIFDMFRKIDDNTVLGVMDFKYDNSGKGYFFVLYRK